MLFLELHGGRAGQLVVRLEWDVAQQNVDLLRRNKLIAIEIIHLERETHFCLHTARKDLQEQFNKEFLIDAALRVILARQRMEPVAHDTRQVDVLDKGDLVDAALRGGCLLRRAEGEVSEDTSEVGPQLFLDEIGVHLRVKVLHVEQVDQGCSCAHRWR